ncbi:MAG: carboxylating nicotinate-nucleotide diphosphorylase [Ilumatobacteraceae bacterium]
MELSPVSGDTSQRLAAAGLDPARIADIIGATVAEDLDGGVDITSVSTVPASQRSIVTFGARADGCLSGLDIACAVVEMVCGAGNVVIERLAADGDRLSKGDVIARVTAPTQRMLTAERTALNLMCHLSGIATATSRWVDAVAGTGAVIRDTRKTTPMLRALEKYAVRCGGGQNHRMSLSDAALVKDNHIAAAGGVREAFGLIRAAAAGLPIEIEVDTLEQLRTAMDAGADVVLLDNMPPAVMREAVAAAAAHRQSTGHDVLLEASGGLTLDNARAVAETGVHFISVGGLTHSSPILDIGLDFETLA